MIFQNLPHERDAQPRRHIRQPNQPAMALSLNENKIPEVLVHGHENPLLDDSPAEDCRISRIFAPLLRLDDVVPLGTKPVRQSAPGAPINEQSHPQETLTASRESCAMMASA